MHEIGVAAVTLGLAVLVFLLGISAGWLSREHRMRAMGIAAVIVGLIIAVIVASTHWFEEMGIAAAIAGWIILVFLLGISAEWLSRERRMRVVGVAAVVVGLIVLAVVAAIYRFSWMGAPAVIVGLIVLVLALGISAGWLPGPHRMRVTGVAAVIVGLIVLAFQAMIYWFEAIEPRLCSESERIATAEQALAFGKQHLLDNGRFWLGLKATREEIEEILRGNCCDAAKRDHLRNDPSRWRVYIGGRKNGKYVFSYDVFFSRCGKDVEVLEEASVLE